MRAPRPMIAQLRCRSQRITPDGLAEPGSGCAPRSRHQRQQGGGEALSRLVGDRVSSLLDQADLELGMMLAHNCEPGLERAARDDVLSSPDRLYGRRDVGKRLG